MNGALPDNYEYFVQGLLTQDEFRSFENLARKLMLGETKHEFKSKRHENEALMI